MLRTLFDVLANHCRIIKMYYNIKINKMLALWTYILFYFIFVTLCALIDNLLNPCYLCSLGIKRGGRLIFFFFKFACFVSTLTLLNLDCI